MNKACGSQAPRSSQETHRQLDALPRAEASALRARRTVDCLHYSYLCNDLGSRPRVGSHTSLGLELEFPRETEPTECVCIYIYTHMCVLSIYLYVCVCVCVCVNLYTYIFIYNLNLQK